MNALVLHTAESLLLVDCGQLFPSEDQPGIDSVIPDFAYVEAFADRLEAVLLTHGHEDHIGALPYFLERWPVIPKGRADFGDRLGREGDGERGGRIRFPPRRRWGA
jgi:ribonuclease J